jgi:V8-like Glu-specific endopeptidase
MVMSDREWWVNRGRDPAGSRDGPLVAGVREASEPGLPEIELNGTFLERYDGPDPSEGRTFQTMPHVELGPENLELILGATSTLLPFHFLRTGDRLGRAVVKLLRSDGASGSGFMVAPGILLTNHHVLPDPGAAGATIALANFETASPGVAPGRPASVPLDPDSLFVTNAELDFTFCGVQGLDFLGTIPLDRNSPNVEALETVNIIQHPRGRPKEVALRDNRVVKIDSVVLHYACSTEPGSSGSPVFNNQWDPVALHHASVVAEGPGGRPVDDPSIDPSARFLNEGIRISAIAIWLEIDETNAPEARAQVARLRGIFGGIDPRIGFFGALGRKAHGKHAPEVVIESYRGETDDLDLAFWNIRGLELGSPEQLDDVVRMVADMGMDLWCLAHADRPYIAALREHLETRFGLEYEFFHEPAGAHPALALLYRRSKALTVERKAWGVEMPEGVSLPLLVTVRAATKRSGTAAFQLVPVGRPSSTDDAPAPYAEAIRHAIRRGHGEVDWIVVGETPVLFAPEKLHILADCGRDLLAAAAERDGAVALLTGPRSKVSQVFISPNLRPAFGVPETLSVTLDRELPPLLRSLGGHQPIALRLIFDGEPRAVHAPSIVPAALTTPATPDHDDLERRVRDMLAPILAKLLADVRTPPRGGA